MRFATRLLAAIGLLWVVVTVTPVCEWWARALAGPWTEARGEILIVPGAETAGEWIGLASYWRSIYAMRAWRDGGFREVVLTGGKGDGPAVSELMRDFLLSQRVIPEAAIRVENRSTSTRENALFTKELLGAAEGKKVLLTSEYHMFRACRAFRKAGVEVTPRPIPDALKTVTYPWLRWGVFQTLCLETGKIGYYLARGWI